MISRRQLVKKLIAGISIPTILTRSALISPTLAQIIQFSGASAGFDWATIDGSPNAAPGTAQYPNLFTSATGGPNSFNNTSAPYGFVPPWKVAGIGYRVGPRFTPTTDPATLVQAGVSVNTGSRSLSIDADNVTLSGIDFSLHSGYQLSISGANAIVEDCNFVLGTNTGDFLISSGAAAATIRYCTVDANTPTSGESSLIQTNGSGQITLLYCWFKNFPQHVLECTQANGVNFSVLYKYNLIENGGITTGAHLNVLQFGGGHGSPVVVEFNTFYQAPQVASGGEGYQFYNNTAGDHPDNISFAYNTTMAVGTTAPTPYSIGNFIHGSDVAISSGSVHDNYFDLTNGFAAFYSGSFPSGWTFSGNINMVTGASIPAGT